MSLRKIKICDNIKTVQKMLDIERKIPVLHNINELEMLNEDEKLSKREFLSLYQALKEIEIWETTTWEEKQLLAPILEVKYDNNNCPVVVFPYFEPLETEETIFRYDEDEIPIELQKRLLTKGMTDEAIGIFLNNLTNFCYKYDLNEDDIILNFSNLGWNKAFGVRIIDYGLTNEMMERFFNNKTLF